MRRVLAIVSGLAMSLAAPAMALAHGHAHAELLEHAEEAHHALHAGEGVAIVDVDSQHNGHAHPAVDPGVFSRLAQWLPALAAPHGAYDFVDLGQGTLAEPPAPFESPPGPAANTPAQPRAPPAPLAV
jgi:hypothetical protein